MYLQSLEILGFKSFAAKTVLNFDHGVTVVVGPNGCGKSNVLDSIRWVLGEQSAKALRGGEMADVIFSGTDSRPALGMAEVSMTFADCEKDLGVAWNEVTITRRVFRDGQGEYFLNKTPCRLKDIHQLFMDTGIGRSAYSIMEQGKIDQILSSRPEDRRAIFEEAAGITKFKSQRKEALRKLEATEANLLRLTDVIREVKRQIGSLQRQAAKAKRYQALLTDLRVLETHNCKRVYDDLESQRKMVAEDSARLNSGQEQREQELKEQETSVAEQRMELEIMEEKLTEARQAVNELKNRVVQGESRIGFNNERIAEFAGLSERYRRDIAGAEEKLNFQQTQLENTDLELETIHEALAAEELRLTEQQQSASEAVINALVERKLGRASLALRDLWKSDAEAFPAQSTNPKLPEGAIGWAMDQVKCQPDVAPLVRELLTGTVLVQNLEAAVRLATAGAAAGERVQFVTMTGELVTREGIVQGGASKEGAGSSVLQRKSQINELQAEAHAIQMTISELNANRTDAAARLEAGQRRLQEAREESQTLNLTLSHMRGQLVTVEQEVRDTQKKTQTFTWERETIERRHDEALARLAQLEEEAYEASSQIAEFQTRQSELNQALIALRESEAVQTAELNEMRVRVATEKQRFASLQNQRQPMNSRMAELREMIEQRARDIDGYSVKAAQLAEDNENVQAGINQARGRLGEAEEHVLTLVAERTEIASQVETKENLLRQTRHELGKFHEWRTQLEVRASQLQSRVEHLCEHVQRRYQLDIREFQADSYTLHITIREHKKRLKIAEGAEKNTEPVASDAPEEDAADPIAGAEADDAPAAQPAPNEAIDWAFVESIIKDLDQKLESMGPVNVEAIQEYDELEERYKFLDQQNTDLNTKAELLQVISKINNTTKTLFADTFEQIRINFQEMFTELFGGGKANLVLQDESDPLESGIDIIARPPGKQLTSITLLSGGEKTMTAVALLFSIYMVKPSPFCVLDEMDAPLDESNINRFIKILDRFSKQSQFVVISHNKRTIARADIIYGVTMEEHGVSKLVGVKFTKREDSGQSADLMGTNNPAPIPSVAESFGKHGDLHSERMAAEGGAPAAETDADAEPAQA